MCVVYVDNIYTIEHEIRDTTGIAIVDSTLELNYNQKLTESLA
jgi:hypothetical protein